MRIRNRLFLIAAGIARGLTALAAGFRSEFAILGKGTLLCRNALAAFACDFTLPVRIHRREATLRGRTTCHLCLLIKGVRASSTARGFDGSGWSGPTFAKNFRKYSCLMNC